MQKIAVTLGTRLARELAKLDRAEEQRMAEEGLGDESWPAS